MRPLPIDSLLPEIRERLELGRSLVLWAPPGAGKTTRVPAALLDLFPNGEVLVLEPRRLAAYLSAVRVAEERGGELGGEVGVQLRFESVCGPNTRLRFVTEGILLRRLMSDPELRGVRAVVLDEFHERHLQGDLALALLARLQRGSRPDLRLCVMSATLETERLAHFLGDCPVVASPGRQYEVTLRYLPEPDDRPVEKQVKSALLRLLPEDEEAQTGETAGDILVFLPGSAEIRRTRDELADVAQARGLVVLPLHGDLPLGEQRRAVVPRLPGAPRKLILSTNVAETSVTIDGVTVVIDSGLARVAGHSPWSGLPTLRVQRICQASATQRAGRAGRTRPGRCLRLYTRHDHDARPEFEVPEIQRLDLSDTVLLLRAAGLDPRGLDWLEPPKEAALEAAETLLRRLGALDEAGAENGGDEAGMGGGDGAGKGGGDRARKITALGRDMSRLPVHPRLSRLVLAGHGRGVGAAACAIAALLGERDLRAGAAFNEPFRGEAAGTDQVGASDVLLRLELFETARQAGFDRDRLRRQGIDAGVAGAVDRVRRQLERMLDGIPGGKGRRTHDEAREQALLFSVLCGYPDRVARRRAQEGSAPSPEVVLCGGGAAAISPRSVVKDAPLMVVVDAEERDDRSGGPGRPGLARARGRSKVMVRLASAIEEDWLLDLPTFSDPGLGIGEVTEVTWNAAAERAEVTWRMRYDRLTLSESRTPGRGGNPEVERVLREAALAASPGTFADAEQLDRLILRLSFAAAHVPEAGFIAPTESTPREALADLCVGRASFAELREASLLDALRARCGLDDAGRERLLGELAPEHVVLPGGRRVRIEYAAAQDPWIASRMQDFFGMAAGPAVARGRVPLILHLLAPNSRPVQVTADLAGFWTRHYPAIRRELCRRYPRHAWPEDPRTAAPPPPRR